MPEVVIAQPTGPELMARTLTACGVAPPRFEPTKKVLGRWAALVYEASE